MGSGIATVFWKELVYTLRDRKTLVFMLLIPAVVIPLAMYGGSRLMISTQKEIAIRSVRLVATEQSRASYRELVHQWFLQTEIAQGLRIASSPILRALVRTEDLTSTEAEDAKILEDPEAFEAWAHKLTGMIRTGLDLPAERANAQAVELPDSFRRSAMGFYQVVIKGLGLIEFVDPASLPPLPEGLEPGGIPDELKSVPAAAQTAWGIAIGAIDGYLEVPTNIASLSSEPDRAEQITLIYDSTRDLSLEAYWRVSDTVARIADVIVGQRLSAKNLDGNFLRPLELTPNTDLATQSEQRLAEIGGILPVFVLIFTLLGGMYPAIDLGAGEKERYTLETLLLSPLSRTEITIGKALVILFASLVAAFLSLTSLAISFAYLIPGSIRQWLDIQFDPWLIVATALLTVPPAISFTGVLLAISIYARSFKEAQNYMTAFTYLVMFLPMAAMIPGLELGWKLSCFPLVNVALLARDALKGTIHWGYYATTLASCLAVAIICIAYAVRQFRREEVLFRS